MQQPQQQLVVFREPKSVGLTYVLWLFLGGLGVHRFYLDRVGSGVGLLVLGLVGWATVWVLIGFLPLTAWAIWLIVDLFLIPDMVEEENRKRSVPLPLGYAPVSYALATYGPATYGHGTDSRTTVAPATDDTPSCLASVAEVVNLSASEAISSAQMFLTRQGYEVLNRTDYSLKARQLHQHFRTDSGPPSVVQVLVCPKAGGGVGVDIMGHDTDPVFKQQRAEWAAWAERLPKLKALPAAEAKDTERLKS